MSKSMNGFAKPRKHASSASLLGHATRGSQILNAPSPPIFPQPLGELERSSSTSSTNSSGATLMSAIRKSVRRYQTCQECGDYTEKTLHCVHCGLVLCDRDRNKHIKDLIDELKALKASSARCVKGANDKKDRVTQTIIDTEHSRQMAKHRINEEFQHLQDMLTARKKELLEKLEVFGRDELKLLNDDKIMLDQYLKDLRTIEMDFHPRLANYTGMCDSSLAKLCQTKVLYQDCMMWIQSLVEKDDSFVPIMFEASQEFRDACCATGSIGYGRAKRFLERRKSYTSLKVGEESLGMVGSAGRLSRTQSMSTAMLAQRGREEGMTASTTRLSMSRKNSTSNHEDEDQENHNHNNHNHNVRNEL